MDGDAGAVRFGVDGEGEDDAGGGGPEKVGKLKEGALPDAQNTDSNTLHSGSVCLEKSSTAACAPTMEENWMTPVA